MAESTRTARSHSTPIPPYQLVAGDQHNLCLGLLAAFALASCKHLPPTVPSFVRWQLSAYTNWNLIFILMRVGLSQTQWEPFLLVNSVSIASAFRTAFAHGLDENMRKKLRVLGVDMPRPLFVALDHLVHTAPPMLLLASILKRNGRIHPMNSIYVLILYTWFSFRQNSTLDVSTLYVPHPWKRAWAGVLAALFTTPRLESARASNSHRTSIASSELCTSQLRNYAIGSSSDADTIYTRSLETHCMLARCSQVDALNARDRRKVLLYASILMLPWLSAKLDPNLRSKYNFECMLAREASGNPEGGGRRGRRGSVTGNLQRARSTSFPQLKPVLESSTLVIDAVAKAHHPHEPSSLYPQHTHPYPVGDDMRPAWAHPPTHQI